MIIPEKNRGKAYQILFALLEWLFVFAIVMDCNSVYANLVDSPFNLQKIALVLGAFLLLCLFLELQMKFLDLIKLAIIPAVCVFFYAGCLLAVMPVEPGYLGSYIKFFMLFLPLCIVLFQLYEKRGRHFALFYRVSDITLILAVLSLVMWTLTVVLDVLEPGKEPFSITVEEMYDEEGTTIVSAPHATMTVRIPCPKEIQKGAFLRQKMPGKAEREADARKCCTKTEG